MEFALEFMGSKVIALQRENRYLYRNILIDTYMYVNM